MTTPARAAWLLGLSTALILFARTAESSPDAEIIRRFHSEIAVHRDASMTVRETIEVHAAGREIRHGIYREFPTTYRDQLGHRYVTNFTVREVLRGGMSEPYHLGTASNGTRVYIGDADTILPPGDYTYTLVYETNRQLGFFADHDELYWNVTGTGWVFPIEEASAAITLPAQVSAQQLALDGYTGPQGARDKQFTSAVEFDGTITFATTAPLSSHEGLTIVVSWPKGLVTEPSGGAKLGYVLRDNRSITIGLIGLLALFGYYLLVWARVGRDPAKGTIVPLYEPPKDLSPGGMRYVLRMGFDDKTFAAALIDMAVKQALSIRCNEADGVYTLIANPRAKTPPLAPEEQQIANVLASASNTLELTQANHLTIRKAIQAVKQALHVGYETRYFVTNSRHFVPGVLLSMLILAASGFVQSPFNGAAVIFLSVWLTLWSLCVTMLLLSVAALWREALKGNVFHRMAAVVPALMLSAFSIPFMAGEAVGLAFLGWMTSAGTIAVLALIVLVNIVFYHLLKAPTRAGRTLLDQIEGFKLFLSAVDADRLRLLNPPNKTPELFERCLPYALALGVEHAWAAQFADVLARAGQGGGSYAPGWYSGSAWSASGMSGFASSLGSSLSGAIASSSTAPGSSSGGGGGGSSGGGGGGGGGGGW